MVYPTFPCLWITVLTATVAVPAADNVRRERDLMVVLPVLQGRNISGDKLQYVYTKAPITMVISDQSTTHRPMPKSWPSSFASKAEVFLVEPSVRRTHPRRSYSDWVRNTIPTSERPNYSAVFHLAKIATPTQPVLPADKFDVSVSKVTWKKSTDKSPVKWLSADETSTQSTAEPTLDITTVNFLQYNASNVSSSSPDDKTVTQLALDLQASTNRLTNDIKSMLLHLGLSAQGPSPQGDSNELGSESGSSDDSSYLQFKNVPLRDELAIKDDMRQLLNTFGLWPPKNKTAFEALNRLKRDTDERLAWPLDMRKLFRQTVNKSLKSEHSASETKRGLEKSTIKPLVGFGYRVSDWKRTRAVDGGAAANKVESKDGKSKGTASVEQLSGSFGGVPAAEQNSTPKTTNGLYFWVDWNTFFNLTGNPDVRLAYSSKAGDPTEFKPFTDWRTRLGNV